MLSLSSAVFSDQTSESLNNSHIDKLLRDQSDVFINFSLVSLVSLLFGLLLRLLSLLLGLLSNLLRLFSFLLLLGSSFGSSQFFLSSGVSNFEGSQGSEGFKRELSLGTTSL